MKHGFSALIAVALATTTAVFAEDAPKEPFVCAAVPEPVVNLDHGSRYVAKDGSRSEFDDASNKQVNAQLKPVDDFISDLASAANRAVSTLADRPAAAECVLTGLTVWAKADALGNLATMNAQLSAPSRLAGFAFAYAQVKPYLDPSEDQKVVERWLSVRAEETMAFFDADAPPKASKNNLRAWAALAVARIGLTVDDAAMIEWADASVRLVACQAAPDGSLPLEMARRDLALHYQLHAVTPLVVTAALLQARGHTLFLACDGAIHRSVRFVLAAFETPDLVTDLTGHRQSYANGSEKLRGFELAWAVAYLSLFHTPELEAFVSEYGTLGNSKIGGEQSLVWGR